MDYRTLSQLRRHHPAWRLLQADHGPLIVAFLQRVFIQPNERVLSESVLRAKLEDMLFALRDTEGDKAFPRAAGDYLNDWADNAKGWLRKFYPAGSDEAHFDLTPACEKAISWLDSLTQRQFVGTESRLMTIFTLLREMREGIETDPEIRLGELEARKAEIEREIARVKAGDIATLDDTALRERYQQLTGTARELLTDFREVEQNFRLLDRQAREQITTWSGHKGELLSHIFGERDAITDSDQGRTFRAFWDFLMAPARQEELSDGLQALFELDAVQAMDPDPRFRQIHFDWLEAGEQTQRTVAQLSQQLRRFLDDQVYLENKRIMALLQDIETRALAVRDTPPTLDAFMHLESPVAAIHLPMERPLFSPPLKPVIDSHVESGDESAVDPEALFHQVIVDRQRLRANIAAELRGREQVTLTEVIDAHPLQVGLAELVTYLSIAGDDRRASVDEQQVDPVSWQDDDNHRRRARVPRVIFSRH